MEPTALASARHAMSASADVRVGRTREVIIGAISSLEADGVPLTVSSLVRRAGVSRSVFYTHFSGVDDLAGFLLRKAFDQIGVEDLEARSTRAVTGAASARRALTRLAEHFDEHRLLYAGVFSASVASGAFAVAVDAFKSQGRLVSPYVGTPPPGIDIDAAMEFIAPGAIGLLAAWVRGELVMTPERIVDHIMIFIPEWLAAEG